MSGRGEPNPVDSGDSRDPGEIYLEGYVKGMRTDSTNGTVLLTIVVSSEFKHDALRTTDDMGVLQEIVFTAKRMDDELNDDAGVGAADDADDIDSGVGWKTFTDPWEGGNQDGEQ